MAPSRLRKVPMPMWYEERDGPMPCQPPVAELSFRLTFGAGFQALGATSGAEDAWALVSGGRRTSPTGAPGGLAGSWVWPASQIHAGPGSVGIRSPRRNASGPYSTVRPARWGNAG